MLIYLHWKLHLQLFSVILLCYSNVTDMLNPRGEYRMLGVDKIKNSKRILSVEIGRLGLLL